MNTLDDDKAKLRLRLLKADIHAAHLEESSQLASKIIEAFLEADGAELTVPGTVGSGHHGHRRALM